MGIVDGRIEQSRRQSRRRSKEMSDPLAIPVVLMVMAIMDYVAWEVFIAVAGVFAPLYMVLLVVLELVALAKGID